MAQQALANELIWRQDQLGRISGA